LPPSSWEKSKPSIEKNGRYRDEDLFYFEDGDNWFPQHTLVNVYQTA
jgi:hypothetical protein